MSKKLLFFSFLIYAVLGFVLRYFREHLIIFIKSDFALGESLSTYSAAELRCLERTLACEVSFYL